MQNTTSEETFDTATEFEIVDTQENSFEPIELEDNEFAYAPERLGPNSVLPNSESPPGQGPIQGSLLLFKLTTEALQNRPARVQDHEPRQSRGRRDRRPRRLVLHRRLDDGLGAPAGAAVSPPAPWPTSSTATATFGFA